MASKLLMAGVGATVTDALSQEIIDQALEGFLDIQILAKDFPSDDDNAVHVKILQEVAHIIKIRASNIMQQLNVAVEAEAVDARQERLLNPPAPETEEEMT
jgi:hypothetical protein